MNFIQYAADLHDDDSFVPEALSTEELEALAIKLAHQLQTRENPQQNLNLLPEVKQASEDLLEAYLFLTKDMHGQGLTPASVWFLDNFHIIEDQLRSIRRDLPKNFYAELPKIAYGEFAGYPRVFALTRTFTAKTDSNLDIEAITRFIRAFQTVTPLTIGELWAIAITFRISLIKQLHPLVERIIFAREKREEGDRIADQILAMAAKVDTRPQDMANHLAESIGKQQKLSRPLIVQLIQRLREQDPSVSKAFDWLEDLLQSCGTNTASIIQLEHLRQAAAQVTIGNIITSMRLISKVDWHDFFEDVSLVDSYLNHDPAQAYARMDRATRDSYRKVIERISKRSEHTENEVAEKALELSAKTIGEDALALRKRHVGYYLLDEGVFELERTLKYRSPLRERFIRYVDRDPTLVYFGTMAALIEIFLFSILEIFEIEGFGTLEFFGLLLLLIVPISELSISALNYAITLLRLPKRLPRMETENGIREQDTTMVVVPCLLTGPSTIQELIDNLEVQFLANQDPHIYFALLGDLCDADQETTAADANLLALAHRGIDELNRRHGKPGEPKFFLFHRVRRLNASEGKWICWERKRGKILEFNRLIRGDRKTTYIDQGLDYDFLRRIEYVITLDADTQLPLQTGRRLVGTITHPLNLPVYDEKANRITAGYGILQPRISVSIVSANKTIFSRIFSGNTGIDPYTTAVSDVYQDLFQEGSFVGKGLYAVDAFERVIGERVPENCVLSHDLLEGTYARVGLTTDMELIDDYPSNFETFAKRMHRWTRGDWQIALWLLPFVPTASGKWARNNLPLIARWKIFDNLRRSLLFPTVLLWLLLSWTLLPGSPLKWTMAILITIGFPVYAPSFGDLFRRHENTWLGHLRLCIREAKNRLQQIIFMLTFMPSMALDQLDAIARSVYRMAISRKHLLEWVTFSQTQSQAHKQFHWKEIITAGPVFSILTSALVFALRREFLIVTVPFLLCWALAPWVSRITRARVRPKVEPLDDAETKSYRRYARMTWHFFETFANEASHWLAPDNFQEDPHPVVAHRTSPTNIGLQLLSTVSAYDLGYIGLRTMVETLEKTVASLMKLERMNGHFYNWYDTLQLTPLEPRYISAVDSGNLAGHLVTLRQACLRLSILPHSSPQARTGVADSLGILIEHIEQAHKKASSPSGHSFKAILSSLRQLDSAKDSWSDLRGKLSLVEAQLQSMDAENLRSVLPWLASLIDQIDSHEDDERSELKELSIRLQSLAVACEEIYLQMDFRFLFDDERKIFSIGFNVNDGRKDNSYYDLLASESRLTSFFAIAKGDVPDEHWFHLGRQLTTVVGSRAMVSWSATMFEYLMPLLVMRRYEGTLLDQTYDSVVLRQIEYGEQRQIPWGVSEAGYNARDLNFNYQYGPFGIPGLGLKRGLRDELVISPYSTMLAAMVLPQESLRNLVRLEKNGVLGSYGFYESIDYTTERVPKGEKFVILKSYMAHHQGMSLISINNILNNWVMQRRFHAEPRVKAVQLLLQERIPPVTQIAKPRAEETHIEGFARFSQDFHTRTYVDPSLSTPRTQLLSNGNYSVMMTTAGAGFSKCEDRMVTRWKEDPIQDNWGQFIYIRDLGSKKVWSAGLQPTVTKSRRYESHFSEDKMDIVREENGIVTHMEVIVSSEDNMELRRLSLTNNSGKTIELELTSYMEVVMARANDDAAHPAFSNLFVQTEFNPEANALIANRRLRNKNEKEMWSIHLLNVEAESIGSTQYETDRSRFLGRGRNVRSPLALHRDDELSGTTGAVLDPIFSLRQKIRIKPLQTARLTYCTGLVFSRQEALRLARKYHDVHIFQRQANLSWVKSQIGLRHLNVTSEKAHIYQRLAGRLFYLSPYLRAQSNVFLENVKNQSALWAYGISGDLPIVLTRINDEKDMDMIRDLLRGHEYLRLKGLKFDLVILNEHATSYLQNLQDELMRQILISGQHSLLDKPGGIFIRRADLIPHHDLVLLKSVARVILFANKGTIVEQLKRRPHEKEMPARFIPTILQRDYQKSELEVPELELFNGIGGFTKDGKEYVIKLSEGQWTPAPWINVVANKKDFGFIMTEAGSGYTWSINSRENRLSSWSNDPVSDPCSEAIYIRDEDTGEHWSPTPLPIRGSGDYLVRHGQGYSVFERISHGIRHEMTAFVPLEDSVKIIRLKVTNISGKPRNLSFTSYIDWVLGFARSQTTQTLTTSWNEESQSIFAVNSYNNEFAHRVAFITSTGENPSFTCDRREFIGRNDCMTTPASLYRRNLSGRCGGGLNPCGVIQTTMELGLDEAKEIIILIGQGEDAKEAMHLARVYRDPNVVNEALIAVKKFWDDTFNTITIQTPEPTMDLLVNRWLPYQTLACRIWARSAFYQSGGAYGYRDQLQDVMAVVHSHPDITRAQIILASSRQFPEGDVQHWWHPPTGRGVRTRFSDDLLWLPFVLNYYVEVTGDESILNEVVPFIETPVLDDEHDETYTHPSTSAQSADIYEHCARTLDRSLKVGAHGLPLMGSGDWNDGMSRVGNLGKGESVWLAWFLLKTLRGFIPHCQSRGDQERAQKYQTHIKELKRAVERNAWDGEWYLRAYFDNGEKMGSHLNEECKIDAIAQSWALISGEGDQVRARQALEAVDEYLIDREVRIIKLFTPPFDKSSADPGYIKGYVPGVRENGGQYTHAAIWTMMAHTLINDGDTANDLFSLINPINRSATVEGMQRYKVEPYVISADIYGVHPHEGRGGWSWYTGSASWMYRAAIESILGLKIQNDVLELSPCIPKNWGEFKLRYRRKGTTFNITVINAGTGASLKFNGEKVEGKKVKLPTDGGTHDILMHMSM